MSTARCGQAASVSRFVPTRVVCYHGFQSSPLRKHGLVGLTRALAVEFTKERLRVNAICPGGMPTSQTTEFQAPENADWDLIMRIASPRGFMATQDVAKTIAFLASDDAAAIHGAVYRVDNGKGAG